MHCNYCADPTSASCICTATAIATIASIANCWAADSYASCINFLGYRLSYTTRGKNHLGCMFRPILFADRNVQRDPIMVAAIGQHERLHTKMSRFAYRKQTKKHEGVPKLGKLRLCWGMWLELRISLGSGQHDWKVPA